METRKSAASFPSEGHAVFVLFAIYAIVQVHALWLHGYSGQDFISHKSWIDQAAIDPWRYLTQYAAGRTNPPLYHFIGGVLKRTLGANRYIFALGVFNVMMSLVGAACIYGVARRIIRSAALRVSAIAFLLFLPVHVIHAEVIAADALATPLFWILVWLVTRFRPDASRGFGVEIAVVVIIGFFVKFTFGFVALACWIWVLSLWWTGRLIGRRLAATALVVCVVPSLVVVFESIRFWPQTSNSWGLAPRTDLWHGEMTPRSLMWLRAADTDVLAAPSYNWQENGAFELLVNNKHSYPALAHLGIFTDILNIYQSDPFDYYFGNRTKRNHHRMQVSVRAGIPFSLLAATAVLFFLFRSTLGVALKRTDWTEVFALLLFSLAWAFPIVFGMFFVVGPYNSGFWLPRLIVPALLAFFMLGFALLNDLPVRWRGVRAAILLIVLVESALHISFLWPVESNRPLYEPNQDVDIAAHLNGAVYRILDWQDAYFPNEAGEYWLEKAFDIVVNRPSTDSGAELWNLSFVLKPGPSNPGDSGAIRVRSPLLAPQEIDFQGVATREIEVPLSPGRNDIHVELVSPAAVEIATDPLIRMASVSQIRITRNGQDAKLLWPY
ncbi:MAG TPA: hypothetical protein VFY29_15510 [Terriglobia bacterium]|nr:hypothetical protein [Terriglobia bacterium]